MALQAVRRETSGGRRGLGDVSQGIGERVTIRCTSAPQLMSSKPKPSGSKSSKSCQSMTTSVANVSTTDVNTASSEVSLGNNPGITQKLDNTTDSTISPHSSATTPAPPVGDSEDNDINTKLGQESVVHRVDSDSDNPGTSTSSTAGNEKVKSVSDMTQEVTTPESTLLQDKIEFATITDMINEQDFVRIPSGRLAQMLINRSISSSIDSELVLSQDIGTQEEQMPRDSQTGQVQDHTEVTQGENEAPLLENVPQDALRESESPSETGDANVTEAEARNNATPSLRVEDNLDIIDDHFVEAEGPEGEVTLPDPEDSGTPNNLLPSDISSSPPSVGGIPSSTPPPTYAECMKDAIPLSFMDFWPQCINLNDENFLFSRFETFDRVIDTANSWLQEHPNIVIRNCETTEVKASSLDEFILHTAAKASTFRSSFRPLLYIRGLRVWYSSKIINKLPFVFAVTPCVLSYKNIKPTLVNVGSHLEYEAMPALIDRCNTQIKEGTIKGRILNVESVCIKEPDSDEDGRIHLFTDPDESTWRDSYFKTARYILRIFFLPDQPAMEKLIFKDFLPENTRHSRSHPKYSDFTSIMDDCRLWLVHLSSCYRVINAQTVEVKHVSKDPPDTKITFISDFEGAARVRFLRVYYAEDLTEANIEFGAPLLSHKTFIPALLKKRKHETLASLMHRVETWLRATGATVVCAETLPVLQQDFSEKKDADFSLYRSEWMEANTEYDHETLLYVVRVYLDTVYPEPPPQIFLDGEEDGFDEDCCIL